MKHCLLSVLSTSPLIFRKLHLFTEDEKQTNKQTPLKSRLIIPSKNVHRYIRNNQKLLICGRRELFLLFYFCCCFKCYSSHTPCGSQCLCSKNTSSWITYCWIWFPNVFKVLFHLFTWGIFVCNILLFSNNVYQILLLMLFWPQKWVEHLFYRL